MSTGTTERKLIYYIATSINGNIADVDGNTGDFSMSAQYIPDYITSLQDYDTVLMGKHTYEAGYKYGIEPGQAAPTYAHMMQYVLSQSMEQYHSEQLQVIRDDPAEFVGSLKAQEGKPIYLCGGGQLAAYLLQHRLIDEIILKLSPLIIGQGISLFADVDAAIQLELLDTKIYSDGYLFLRYRVLAE